MTRDYPKKFSASLMKKYAGGGEVKKGVPSGWPGPGRGSPNSDEASDNFDNWLQEVRSSKGTSDDPHINEAPAEELERAEPPDTSSEDEDEYRRGGPVKKRRKS